MARLRIWLWAAAALSVALVALIGSGVLRMPEQSAIPGAANVGGPFELTGHDGQRFSSARLAGRPYALFFGFTQCPDVCPTTLLEMSNHLAALGPRADRLNILFVTIDPERDGPEQLKAYLANFDARITGLTGSPAEIAAVAKSYRAYYEKVATSGGYTMNHTAIVYLMDAKGGFAGTMNFQEPQTVQFAKLSRLAGQ